MKKHQRTTGNKAHRPRRRLQPVVRLDAVVCTDSWAGRQEKPCRVIGETATKYRIEVDVPTGLPPGLTILLPGQTRLVPKRAVRFMRPNEK